MMIFLLAIALTILCICSVMELALLILFCAKSSLNLLSKTSKPFQSQSESVPNASDEETMARARKRYEDELMAFQDLLNYNSDVAYGIDRTETEE